MTTKERDMSDEATIKTMDDGPLIVSGTFTVTDGEGTTYAVDGDMAALCRCGASANKPFCDGGHKDAGFSADNRAG